MATIEIGIPEPGNDTTPKRLLKVYEAKSGKETLSVDFSSAGGSRVLFSPDNSRLALARGTPIDSAPRKARTEWQIRDARTGKLITNFEDPAGQIDPDALRGEVLRARERFSHDGTLFILAVDNVIHIFDTKTGQPVHTFRGCENPIADVVALPDGKLRIIEAGRTIREWDLGRVKEVRTAIVERADGAGGRFPGLASASLGSSSVVSADGAWVAVLARRTSDDGPVETVRVWDAAGKGFVKLEVPARDWPAGTSPLKRLDLSADGKRVALFRYVSPGFGGGPGGQPPKNDRGPLPPPDVTVWDVASKEVIFQREFPRNPGPAVGPFGLGADTIVALSPDGNTLAVVHRGGDGEKRKTTLTFVDVNTKHDGKPIEVDDNIRTVSFSPDSKRLEGGAGTGAGELLDNSRVAVWDVATGSRICTIENVPADLSPGQGQRFTSLAKCWSPDGTRLAMVGPGGARIHLFDTATGKLAKSLDVSNRGGRISTSLFAGGVLAFSPDGRRIAFLVTGRADQPPTVNVIDTESGKELLSLPHPARVITPGAALGPRGLTGESMRFTPDGHRLLYFTPATGETADAPPKRESYLRVTTWDATPRPEPKSP